MKLPRKKTSGYKLVQTFYQSGPMTFEQGCEVHGILDRSESRTRETYRRAVSAGWLINNGGVYTLADPMRRLLDDSQEEMPPKENVVPPRTPAPFRELSSKYIPSRVARRHDADPPRDIHFRFATPREEPQRSPNADT
jgi:hypothetical protein